VLKKTVSVKVETIGVVLLISLLVISYAYSSGQAASWERINSYVNPLTEGTNTNPITNILHNLQSGIPAPSLADYIAGGYR
jgi:hypothetical protein